jgi:hypothetical protein
MFRTRWIRKLLAFPHVKGQCRRQAAQTRRPVRLMLEPLEERLTPSDATVTQTAGSYTELKGLIAGDTATNTNYIINITNSFTFAAGGQVAISKLAPTSTLSIETPSGSSPFTLTGNGNRLFNVVGTSQTVTLSNLTLTGGARLPPAAPSWTREAVSASAA